MALTPAGIDQDGRVLEGAEGGLEVIQTFGPGPPEASVRDVDRGRHRRPPQLAPGIAPRALEGAGGLAHPDDQGAGELEGFQIAVAGRWALDDGNACLLARTRRSEGRTRGPW